MNYQFLYSLISTPVGAAYSELLIASLNKAQYINEYPSSMEYIYHTAFINYAAFGALHYHNDSDFVRNTLGTPQQFIDKFYSLKS
jgi:hypothetical protein